jgi:hypothetical protein
MELTIKNVEKNLDLLSLEREKRERKKEEIQ